MLSVLLLGFLVGGAHSNAIPFGFQQPNARVNFMPRPVATYPMESATLDAQPNLFPQQQQIGFPQPQNSFPQQQQPNLIPQFQPQQPSLFNAIATQATSLYNSALGRGHEIGRNATEIGALRIGQAVNGLFDNLERTVEGYRPSQPPSEMHSSGNKKNNQNSIPNVTNFPMTQNAGYVWPHTAQQ